MKFRIIEQNGNFVPQQYKKSYSYSKPVWQNVFVGGRYGDTKAVKFTSEQLARQFIALIKNQAIAEKKKKTVKIVYSD
jgi:hypothetical protein